MYGGRVADFSYVFMEPTGYYLKGFCLARLPTFWPLTRRDRLSLELFGAVAVGVSELPFSLAPSLG